MNKKVADQIQKDANKMASQMPFCASALARTMGCPENAVTRMLEQEIKSALIQCPGIMERLVPSSSSSSKHHHKRPRPDVPQEARCQASRANSKKQCRNRRKEGLQYCNNHADYQPTGEEPWVVAGATVPALEAAAVMQDAEPPKKKARRVHLKKVATAADDDDGIEDEPEDDEEDPEDATAKLLEDFDDDVD
jgi:hypothetical protein